MTSCCNIIFFILGSIIVAMGGLIGYYMHRYRRLVNKQLRIINENMELKKQVKISLQPPYAKTIDSMSSRELADVFHNMIIKMIDRRGQSEEE
jgi:isocitrate dehydrogenase kinase/phosphatase